MTIWFLVGYMWFYIHRVFERWTAFEGYNLTHTYLAFLAIVWLFIGDKSRFFRNIFTPALLLYTLVIVISAIFGPYVAVFDNWNLNNWLLHVAFFLILIMCVKTEREMKILLTGFTIVYFIFMMDSYWNYIYGSAYFSMGIQRLQGAVGSRASTNGYATALVCALPMLVALLTLCKRYWHYLFVLGYVLLAVRSVMLSGSRTALIMLIALAVLPVLFSRYRFHLIPIVLIALPVGWMVMPEEMQNRFRTTWDPSVERLQGQGGATVSRDGRIQGFYDGLNNWLKHPILGTGPGGHMQASGANLIAHNLPGQVAGELGTLGIITFLFVLSCFGVNHYNNWKNYKFLRENNFSKEGLYCWRVSIAVIYAIAMVLIQGIGLNNAWFYQWAWFGAFHALATMFMQEKVDAAIKGKLLPSLPVTKG